MKRGLIFLLLLIGLIILAETAGPPLYNIFRFAEPVSSSTSHRPDHIGFDGIDLSTLVMWLFNLSLAWILGWAILRNFVRGPNILRAQQVLATFWGGYLGIVALSRLVGLFTKDVGFYAIMVAILIWIFRTHCKKNTSMNMGAKDRKSNIAFACFCVGLYFLIQMQQIFQAELRWVGHGTQQYVEGYLPFANSRFPIVSQHYDEPLFFYFISKPIPNTVANPLIAWWITLGLVKISVFAFFATCFQIFEIPRKTAWLFAFFLTVGTLAASPAKYYLLFDSVNPIMFTAHSGRIVGVAMGALILMSFLRGFGWSSRVGLYLLGAGIAATTASNILMLIPLFLALIQPNDSKFQLNRNNILLATGSLGLIPLLYSADISPVGIYVIFLIAVALALYMARGLKRWRSLSAEKRDVFIVMKPFWIGASGSWTTWRCRARPR